MRIWSPSNLKHFKLTNLRESRVENLRKSVGHCSNPSLHKRLTLPDPHNVAITHAVHATYLEPIPKCA